jgi:hypothetical protein
MTDELDLHQLRADTVARLRPLCPDMPEDDFVRMVDEMVTVRWKYEERQRDVLFGSGEHAAPDDGPFPGASSPPPGA